MKRNYLLSISLFVVLLTAVGFSVHDAHALGSGLTALDFGPGAIALLATGLPVVPEDTLKEIKSLGENAAKAMRTALGLEEQIKASKDGTAEAKEMASKAVADVATINDQIKTLRDEATKRQDEFEEKMQAKGFGSPNGTGDLSMGANVIKSYTDSGTNLGMSRGRLSAKFDASDVVFKTITAAGASGGPLLVPRYEPGILAPGQPAVTLLDLVPSDIVEEAAISYARELAVTNGFAFQSNNYTGAGQGTALGTSDFTFARVTDEMRTAGHKGKIALQMLKHERQLRAYVEGRARYMTRYGIEGAVLNGDGTGNSFEGINEQATAYDATLDTQFGVTPTEMSIADVLRLAIYQAGLSEFAPDMLVINQREAARMDLEKDGDKRYLYANPMVEGGMSRPWGLTPVQSRQQTVDTFTVGNASMGLQLWIGEQATFEVSTENADDFEKLLATWRSYIMAVLAVYRPSSWVTGTFAVARAANA